MDFTYPANVCFECNGCSLCCGDTEQKTRRILLLESEAKTISEQTTRPIEEFSESSVGTTPYVYEMKKPTEGKCFFLKDKQCTIYENRPLICRFYPFELKYDQDGGNYVFNFTLECPMIKRGRPMVKKDFDELFALASERLP